MGDYRLFFHKSLSFKTNLLTVISFS